MTRLHFARTASLSVSLVGALVNFAFAVQLLSAWRSLRWEPESEWEGSENSWRGDGVKLVWGLLSAYFAVAATVCLIGFVGIVKSISSFVRFYRDYSIADFSFCTFFTVLGTYAAFRTPVRAVVCEELSRQPVLMRDLAEMGLNLENCELWFERVVLAFMMVMVVLIVIRLHFLIALSNYYSYLSTQQSTNLPMHMTWRSQASDDSGQHQHIYLLPRPSTFHAAATPQTADDNDILVYAPIPLSSMSPQQAQKLRTSATEAWISRTEPNSASTSSAQTLRSHRHGHRRHGSSGSRGRISLPVRPDEGLLPAYEDSMRPLLSPSVKV